MIVLSAESKSGYMHVSAFANHEIESCVVNYNIDGWQEREDAEK